MKSMLRPVAFLLLTLGLVLGFEQGAFADGDRCSDPANLMFNCDFNTFTDYSTGDSTRVIADGWYFWVESGNPAFEHGQDSPVPPSQQIWSDGGNFRVGIYQTVPNLTPGATYIAGVGWVPYTAPDGSIMRQVGIDPYGGTDPLSPTVVWGPEDWRFSRFTNLEVRAVAQTSTITVFIRIFNPHSHGADIVFIDGANLLLDTSVPVVPVAGQVTPTPTEIPASPTPLPTPPATETAVPATATTIPATATSAPPTFTAVPPTNTAAVSPTQEPTERALPPTVTELPATPTARPTRTPHPTAAIEPTVVPVEPTSEVVATIAPEPIHEGDVTESSAVPEIALLPATAEATPAPEASVTATPSASPAGIVAMLAAMGIAGIGGGWLLFKRRG